MFSHAFHAYMVSIITSRAEPRNANTWALIGVNFLNALAVGPCLSSRWADASHLQGKSPRSRQKSRRHRWCTGNVS